MNGRTKSKACLIISIFLFGMACTAAAGQTIYVDADASGANDGSSWADAYNYLQDALTDANSALKPVEIRVAEGIYTPDSNSANPNGSGDRTATFQLINGVTFRGGYAGFGEPDPDSRDVDIYKTILSGDLTGNDIEIDDPRYLLTEPTRSENSYHVVTGSGTDETAKLDGITITGGNANEYYQTIPIHANGGGMYNESGSPSLLSCTFRENSASYGGGMYNDNSDSLMLKCSFIRNWANYIGGGIHSKGNSNQKLINCIFIRNSSGGSGGGLCDRYSELILTNCIFSGNLAEDTGGGMYNYYASSSSPVLFNCTFTGNRATWGGGVSNYQSDATIKNCIFWNNFSYRRYPQLNLSGLTTVTYSCIQDWAGWGQGNIDADPCFVLPGYWADVNDPNIIIEPNHPNSVWIDGDYHLKSEGWRWDSIRERWHYDQVTSRCIDAGNPGSLLGEELLFIPDDPNNVWGRNLRINMGAYGGTAWASIPPYNWSLLTDLTNDGKVNSIDLADWTEYWLGSSGDLPGDFDRNFFVNMFDFSLLARDWLRCTSFWITEPPFVRITKPDDGSSFAFGQSVEIEAEAWDSDGTVVRVEFFQNTDKIGEDVDGSDGWKIISYPILDTTFTAKATDNNGSKAISVPVTVYPTFP